MKNLRLIAPLFSMLIAEASALVVTQFDIDDPTNNGGTSSTQSGWIAAPGGNGSNGTYSLATTGGISTRTRTTHGGGSEADMWKDLLLGGAAGSDVSTVVMTVSGLQPNTGYRATLWSYDYNSVGPGATNQPRSFQLATNLETKPVDWPAGAPAPASLADHAFDLVGSSDAAGNLVITATETGVMINQFNIIINGLRIETLDPNAATLPNPPDGAPSVDPNTALSWNAPTAYTPTQYEVFFGPDPDVTANPVYSVTTNTYQPAESPLAPGSTWYWAVVSHDGTTPTISDTWSFTTAMPRDLVAGNLIMMNDNAGWCWYQDEKIIYDPVSKSILASTTASGLGHGASARDADIDNTAFNRTTGKRTRVVMGNVPYIGNGHPGHEIPYAPGVLPNPADDHNMGAIWIRPDGRYLHMYTGHNDASRNSRIRLSAEPNNAETWYPETHFNWATIGSPDTSSNATYHNLFHLTAEGGEMGRLYNITREAKRSPNIAYSDDWGVTWHYGGKLTLPRSTSSYSNGYLKFTGNGVDRIDFISTEHHPRNFNNSIYHGYIKDGKSHNADGQVIDSNIFDEIAPSPADFTPVFVSSPVDENSYHHAWTTELERDSEGNLYGLITCRFGTSVHPSNSVAGGSKPGSGDHRIFYLRFDAATATWHQTELARMGWGLWSLEQDYTGLGTIHPDNPNLIYISTRFDPRNTNQYDHHEIFKGETSDQGATWQWTQITTHSHVDNLRPAIPKWDPTHTAVFWLRGRYGSQNNFDQALVGLVEVPTETMGLVRYTDASPENTTRVGGGVFEPTGPSAAIGAADDQWHEFTGYGNEGSAYLSQAGGSENAPALQTTIGNLAAGTYDVFAFFWSPLSEDWRISAGFDSTDLLTFRRQASRQAEVDDFSSPATTLGGSAALYRAYIGRKKVEADGSISVIIDDAAGKTAYDGIGIARVNPVLPMSDLVITRGSGQVDLAWDDVPGAAGYVVKRSTDPDGEYVTLDTTLDSHFPDTTVEPGINYSYQIFAMNDLGEGEAVESSITTYTRIEMWRQSMLGTTENTGDAADDADPDGDGRSNLMEYATGTHPLENTPGSIIALDTDSTFASLAFQRIADPTLAYKVSASDDLVTWDEIWSSTGIDNQAGDVRVFDTQPMGDKTKRFFMLGVSRQ